MPVRAPLHVSPALVALLRPNCLALFAATAILFPLSAEASSDPTGLWYDHDGRGAVEVSQCDNGKGYCGYIVHVKDPKKLKNCGTQILGNVTPGGGGWIYSPSRGRRFDVEVTRLSETKLRVVGNAGHFFSKTFTWNRAPDDVERCKETATGEPTKATDAATPAAGTPVKAVAGAKPDREAAPLPPLSKSVTGTLLSTMRPASQSRSIVANEPLPAAKAKAVGNEIAPRVATASAKPIETADAPDAQVAEDEAPVKKSGRKCKFRIPYIGRTITVPCRN